MNTAPGRMNQSKGVNMTFRFRAKIDIQNNKPNAVDAVISRNLSKNGGSDSQREPAKESDPNI